MRYLAWFSFSFAAACALYVSALPAAVLYALCGLCAAGGCVLAALRRRHVRCAAVVLIGLAAGLAWCMAFFHVWYQPAVAAAGSVLPLEATVCDTPEETDYGVSALVRTELGGRTTKVLLYLDEDAPEVRLGDRVALPALLSLSSRSTDWENLYYNAKGIYLIATQKGTCEVVRPETIALRDRPAQLRQMVRQQISMVFEADIAPFMTALLTGGRAQLTEAQSSDLRISGVYHIVSVSGMHVSILLGFLLVGLKRRRRGAAFIGIPATAAFLAFIGGTPGVLRAGIVYAFALAAPLLRREADSPTSLGAALLAMLLVNPFAIANIGLQLSFAATAGILLLYGRLAGVVTRTGWLKRLRGTHRRLAGAVQFLVGVLATTLSALVFTVPLMAYWFGTISLIAPLTNLLVVPVVSSCFVLGLLTIPFSLLVPPVGAALAWTAGWLARYILGVAHAMASVPYAQIGTESPFVTAWLLFAYAVLVLMAVRKPLRVRPLSAACSLALTLAASLLLTAFSSAADGCSVTALDVGQGQCILLRLDSFTAVVDCGGDDSPGDVCAQALLDAGDATLDALVLTHFDRDHINGAETLFRRLTVGTLYLPAESEDAQAQETIVAAAQAAGTQVCFVTDDLALRLDAGTITVFAPVAQGADNDACLSVLCTSGEFDVLVTGDLDTAMENRLLALQSLPNLEVLVAGHHGSKSSTGERLLAETTPEAVLIPVGENRYGHPADETLERIEAAGAAYYRTDECGTVTIRR